VKFGLGVALGLEVGNNSCNNAMSHESLSFTYPGT